MYPYQYGYADPIGISRPLSKIKNRILYLFGLSRSFLSSRLDVVDVLLMSGRRFVSCQTRWCRSDGDFTVITESGFWSVRISFHPWEFTFKLFPVFTDNPGVLSHPGQQQWCCYLCNNSNNSLLRKYVRCWLIFFQKFEILNFPNNLFCPTKVIIK